MGNTQEEGKLKMLRTGWWGKGNDTLSSGHDHGHNTDELFTGKTAEHAWTQLDLSIFQPRMPQGFMGPSSSAETTGGWWL